MLEWVINNVVYNRPSINPFYEVISDDHYEWERVYDRVSKYEGGSEWVSEWVTTGKSEREWVCERVNEWVWLNECERVRTWKSVKIQAASAGFESMSYAMPVQWSTNWATKPHGWEQGNLLDSFGSVKGITNENAFVSACIRLLVFLLLCFFSQVWTSEGHQLVRSKSFIKQRPLALSMWLLSYIWCILQTLNWQWIKTWSSRSGEHWKQCSL